MHLVDIFDTPTNSKLAKISSLKFMFKKPYLSQYWMDFTNEGSELNWIVCNLNKLAHTFQVNIQNESHIYAGYNYYSELGTCILIYA